MRKEQTTITWICDLCETESLEEMEDVNVPHWFLTEQTGGNPIKLYISSATLDLCDACVREVVVVKGWGAQGYNTYRIGRVDD